MRTNLAYAFDQEDFPITPVALSSAPTKKKTILVIEDDLILSQTIKRFAEKYYENVLIFDCAEKASNFLRNSNITIDLALIDYFLPGENGADFAQKALKNNLKGKLYLMSGDLPHIKNDASLNNFDDFLAKPLSLKKIREIIEAD